MSSAYSMESSEILLNFQLRCARDSNQTSNLDILIGSARIGAQLGFKINCNKFPNGIHRKIDR